MGVKFRLPDVGEGMTEAEVIRWLVQEGERVASDQRSGRDADGQSGGGAPRSRFRKGGSPPLERRGEGGGGRSVVGD